MPVTIRIPTQLRPLAGGEATVAVPGSTVAEVLKGLVQLHQAKPLSFREKKMLDRAVALLSGEMASACRLSESAAMALVEQALAEAALVLPPPDPNH